MKKNGSAWDRKMWTFAVRWRWVITFGAALQIWSVAIGHKTHDAMGLSWLPSAWVLPYQILECVSTCTITAMIWTMHRNLRLGK